MLSDERIRGVCFSLYFRNVYHCTRDPFVYGLTLILTWISHHMPDKGCHIYSVTTGSGITSGMEIMCDRLNDDLEKIREWLCCNKLSLNVLETYYMIFAPRNKIVFDVNIQINCVSIERVYCSKFLGVIIDSKLSWKNHIDYTCNKLSKCVRILCKTRKKLPKPSLINLYYSFAYP